jgi:hypothetical protein
MGIWQRLAIMAMALQVSAGCGGSGRPVLYKVTGKVTINGTPLAGADVVFDPVDPTSGARGAVGRTRDDGSFVVGTFSNDDGATAGEFKVTVNKVRLKPGIDTKSLMATPPREGADPSPGADAYARMMIGTKPESATEPDAEVPEKYGSKATTDLRAVVAKDSPNQFNFDLK